MSIGKREIDSWTVSIDAYKQMVEFLRVTPHGMRFTQHDRESLERDLERYSKMIGQMDSGQRGRGVSFDEIPHITARVMAACYKMKLSGALDRLEVDLCIDEEG